jgi:glycosyltransferase involved in cell wall biosynthesis
VKVLFVVNDLSRAGAEKQLTLLACGLKSIGWSTSIVVIKERNDFAEPLGAAAIAVTPLRRRGPLDMGVVSRLRRVVRQTAPDAVVSFLFFANAITVLASRRLDPRPKIVLSVRESYQRNLHPALRFAGRLSHLGADLVLCNSEAVLREEQAAFPRARHLAYLPNAVPPLSVAPFDWSTLGIQPGSVVVSVGQLAPVKGHRILVEAFANVTRVNPAAHLVIVGEGPERDGLQALAAGLGLRDRITFAGHQADALRYVAAADVFVQPSRSEGMSNSLMEAMALGRSIVATRVGAAADLIEDGREGLLTTPTAPGLSAALIQSLADRDLRERLGRAAHRKAGEFSVDRTVSGLDRILRDLVFGSTPDPGS